MCSICAFVKIQELTLSPKEASLHLLYVNEAWRIKYALYTFSIQPILFSSSHPQFSLPRQIFPSPQALDLRYFVLILKRNSTPI